MSLTKNQEKRLEAHRARHAACPNPDSCADIVEQYEALEVGALYKLDLSKDININGLYIFDDAFLFYDPKMTFDSGPVPSAFTLNLKEPQYFVFLGSVEDVYGPDAAYSHEYIWLYGKDICLFETVIDDFLYRLEKIS